MPIAVLVRTLLLFALALALAAPAQSDDYRDKAEALEALRERISVIESDLEERQVQRDQVATELRSLEQAIGDTLRRLEALDHRVEARKTQAEELREAVDAQEQAVAGHRQVLQREIRDAYTSGRQQYLKLLLNQEDPAALDRLLVYVDYIGRARSERIREAMAAMEDYRAMRAELHDELDELDGLRREQEEERERLAERRRVRESVLARVEAAIGDDQDRLERLEGDEEELQALVDELQQALADIADEEVEQAPFQERRGELPWPVGGELAAGFGDRRSSGGDWHGVLVRADPGTRVEAVSYGRVVFANWLRGLGLLLIIDHGDGYMTLYGYNESLYKDVGDWVDSGDVIARVGDSGGRDQAGLYFELRVEGQPEDPLSWLDSNRP
ncbi:peptidoglycan DD-metalloendopeptidase family protein [Aquisalimonas sp.]|uniref:murein hydrolase activator EnvC family protein n=1 Tax=Aquisalimonas sp. TaxID=1872621 RepID=UPI0025C5EABD|nr:peptidoglycan DD-metalloendopeptidase family protein [Aquisalimonas sp.]